METRELTVQWAVSARDLVRGLHADVGPHLVVVGIAVVWLRAGAGGVVPALAPLALVLLATQVVALLHLLAIRLPSPLGTRRSLEVRGTAFVLRTEGEIEVFDEPLAGVFDSRGVLRLHFVDGRTVEVPWRAFSNADLRRVRRVLRTRTGRPAHPLHLPVRRVGHVPGRGGWPHPAVAAVGAVVLAALPWLLPGVGS